MTRSKGDIRVIGMVAGTHVIEDLQRDVPYRTLVIIPEEQALMSKDLWRAISQGHLLRIASAPYPTGAPPMPAHDSDKARLEKYCVELEGHVLRLKSENDSLRRQLESSANAHSAKLDEILAALQTGIRMVPLPVDYRGPNGPQTCHSLGDDLIDGSAPTFLPAEIVPKDIDSRITIQGEESTSEGVSDAAERLRRLRKEAR